MPELAEVEHHRRRWDPGLGHTIAAAKVHAGTRVYRGTNANAIARSLRGQTLLESWAHGKQMLFHFSGGHWLGLHLGMTGELRIEARAFTPGRHDHLVLEQDRQSLVFADPRQFGRVRLEHGAEAPAWWRRLPPAILSAGFTAERVETFLRRRAGSPIKAVLLMQEGFPGVGNWMADEILWRARLHPKIRSGRLAPLADLVWRETRRVAAGAIRFVAPDYADPPPTWLFRHRWSAGGCCPRDQSILRRAEVGGRTTAWCALCQPATPPRS